MRSAAFPGSCSRARRWVRPPSPRASRAAAPLLR
jgi:hypothetical protein